MSVVITLGVVVLLGLWGVAVYNRLIGLRNQVQNGWRQIEVQLKRRHDLIPNLVEAVRSAVSFERETLEAVVAARQQAATARGPVDAAAKEGALNKAVVRLMAVVESYPQLNESPNVRTLQEELAGTENTIGAARRAYNAAATAYNTATDVVPGNLVAGLGSFPKAELFEIKGAAERAVPAVELR